MSKSRIIGVVCLCCMLITSLASAGEAVRTHQLYERAISAARGEIWQRHQ